MALIPIHDDNPRRHVRWPWVTWSLILASVLVFLWQTGLDRLAAREAILALGVVPLSLLRGVPLPPEIALLPPMLTLVSSLFLHGGWAHLIGNMLYLYIFGDNIEDSMGHAKFLGFYLLCGAAAGLVHAAVAPGSPVPVIGASGAISGVLGAYILLHPRARITVLLTLWLPIRLSAMTLLVIWFVMQLIQASFAPVGGGGVAWWAHIGGFIAGLVLTPLLKLADVPLWRQPPRGPWG
jgi:membrane associated rhomboid family serine protease